MAGSLDRAHPQLPGVSPTVFYLVRHAHAPWPGPGGGTEDGDRPLSAAGRTAAETLAGSLARHPIDLIVSSPSLRAVQTVRPLADLLRLPVVIEPDLRERRLGDEEVAGTQAFREAVAATWRDLTFAHPGGESNAAAQARGAAVLDGLQRARPGAKIVIGTHGNLLALMVRQHNAAIGWSFWASLAMPDLVVLTVSAAGEATVARPAWRVARPDAGHSS